MTDPLPTLSQGWVVAMVAAIVVQVVVPLVAGLIVRRWLGVGWRFFAYGMLIFFIFQIATRIPAIRIAEHMLGPVLRTSPVVLWTWLVVASVTAGIFEEIGRWVAFRFLMRHDERTWAASVMYGLGHGGLESMVLVAGLSAVTLASVLALTGTNLSLLPPDQREAAETQLFVLTAQPGWFPLLGAWERISSLAIHVGLSVTVLQAFHRGHVRWLSIAILAHSTVNLIGAGLLLVLGPSRTSSAVITEIAIAGMAAIALWVAWKLRDSPLVGAARGV